MSRLGAKSIARFLFLSLFFFSVSATHGHAQDLAFSRRLSILAPAFAGGADKKTDALRSEGSEGTVLVIFRTSEQGWVVDARTMGGSPKAQQAALAAIKQWKFKPAAAAGQPVEFHSALVFDFSHTPVSAETPRPMTAEQLSPVLGAKCLNALLKRDSGSVELCKQQMATVEAASNSTPVERFTAHDEYGLALLQYAHKAKDAVRQFDRAVQLAPHGFKSTDAEWAYVHWHRAVAEQ